MARIAATNGPVDALVLVGGSASGRLAGAASDEVIALNLHGPIHFARAYLPAGHDGVAHGARALARKAHRRAHRQPAASPRRSAPGPCARPNWPFQIGRWQSGHAGDRRHAWSDGLEWPVQMWNHDAGAVSGGSKHRTAVLRWVTPGPAPCVWPADSWAAGLPWTSSTRWQSRGETTQVVLPAFGPCGAPEAEAPQRSVGQGTPSRALSA